MAGALVAPELRQYLASLVPPRPPEMVAMEEYARTTGFPIIGPVAGYVCYLVARMIGARRIFEMGSGYGYSTAWFARAVLENGGGTVYHVVWDADLSARARRHLRALGYEGVVQYRVAEAVGALRDTDGPFDLIFNDIDKESYPDALPVIADRLRPGGVLIADNALWQGRVFDPQDRSPATEGVRRFTQMVASDPRWIATVVPVRDGLLLALWTGAARPERL
jgi:caffeoyl-CoA O-methyltransferase